MRKTTVLALFLAFFLTAAGSTDPLVTQSYLTGAYTQELDAAIGAKLDASDAALRGNPSPDAPAEPPAGLKERTLKEGDILTAAAGLAITSLGGDVRLDIASGAAVDVTAGTEVPSGQLLQPCHRYIAAEGAAVTFTVTSPAAVLAWEGGGTLTLSQTPDYYAIACALRDLGLFQGTGSGIGDGFELYDAPTRGEGLVMFLRILGEEEQALAAQLDHPFTDVPNWLSPYVAWAYRHGYANGVSADRFGSDRTVSAAEYEEFLLRALGYSTAGVDDYATSLERAQAYGVLTPGEYDCLSAAFFTRAHAAYLSYYALDVPVSGAPYTLGDRFVAGGLLTEGQLSAAKQGIQTERIF